MTGIPPGSYVLGTSTLGSHPFYAQVPVDLSPGENLSGLQAPLSRLLELSGRVSADPSTTLKLAALFVSLQPDVSNVASGGAFADVQPDGTFSLKNVPPGGCRLNVRNFPPRYYLKSATLDGTDVLENGLTLVAGSSPGELVLYPSLDAGSVTATVLGDDEPERNCRADS